MTVSCKLVPGTQAQVIKIRTRRGSVILINGGNGFGVVGKPFNETIIA
jgi:hypothetical protein